MSECMGEHKLASLEIIIINRGQEKFLYKQYPNCMLCLCLRGSFDKVLNIVLAVLPFNV